MLNDGALYDMWVSYESKQKKVYSKQMQLIMHKNMHRPNQKTLRKDLNEVMDDGSTAGYLKKVMEKINHVTKICVSREPNKGEDARYAEGSQYEPCYFYLWLKGQ